MVLWGGMVHKYTMLKAFSIKIHIMVIQTSFRLSKWDFFFLSSRVRGDRAWAFWFRPRIRAALIQGCQEHFSDPKRPIGKWSNFNPPFWEFSRKAGHARSRPQPCVACSSQKRRATCTCQLSKTTTHTLRTKLTHRSRTVISSKFYA